MNFIMAHSRSILLTATLHNVHASINMHQWPSSGGVFSTSVLNIEGEKILPRGKFSVPASKLHRFFFNFSTHADFQVTLDPAFPPDYQNTVSLLWSYLSSESSNTPQGAVTWSFQLLALRSPGGHNRGRERGGGGQKYMRTSSTSHVDRSWEFLMPLF